MTQKPINRFQPKTRYKIVEGMEDVTGEQPRLGKIRLGIKVKKAKTDARCKHREGEDMCMFCSYPKDVDYFVCPPEVQEVYGEKPRMLEVLLPGDDLEEFFEYKLVWYKGNRRICHGNNRSATRINEDTGESFVMDCPCEMLKTPENPKGPCNLKAHLMVILPRVSMAGCYQIDTGSFLAIKGILRQVKYIRNLIRRVGFVPLHLIREEEHFQYSDANGALKSGKRWIVKIRLPKELNYAKLHAFRQADIIGLEGREQERPALPPPTPVDDGEDEAPGAVVVDEAQVDVPPEENGTIEEAEVVESPPEPEELPFEDEPPPEKEPPPPATPAEDMGPPISKARQNILTALLHSKGYKSTQEADQYLSAKYGIKGVAFVQAGQYERIKDELSKLKNQ